MAHISKASYPICPLCNEHIEIETANTNEKGKAVHEDCYVAHLRAQNQSMISAEHAMSILNSAGHQRDSTAATLKTSS